ncbi:MAG: right-handed parallel beta-helix repeat-containing protein [Planctomycetota bacterium]
MRIEFPRRLGTALLRVHGLSLCAALGIYAGVSGPAAHGQTFSGSVIETAISSANPGDTIQLQSGTYLLDNTLAFSKSNLTLQGQADGSTIIQFAGGFDQTGNDTPLIDLSGQAGVTLRNLKLDGEDRTNGASYGVYAFGGGGGHVLEHLNITNLANPGQFAPIGIYLEGGVSQTAIRQNTITDVGLNSDFGSGIRVHGDSDYNIIEYNTIDGTGRGGIFALGNSDSNLGASTLDGLVIRHNTVVNSAQGLTPGQAVGDLGIELQNDIADAVIEDNVIDRRVSLDNVQRVAVRRNTVSQSSNTTTTTASYGLELVDAQDVVFDNNQVLGDIHFGVSISGDGDTRYTLFEGNNIQDATTFGVQVQGNDTGGPGSAERLLFANNMITGTSGVGALFPNTGDGFRFNEAFDEITLDGNTLTGNDGFEIALVNPPSGSTITLSDNTIEGDSREDPTSAVYQILDPPLTRQTLEFETGDTITVVFDDLSGTVVHVLWDLGTGAPLVTSDENFSENTDSLTPGTEFLVVGWDDLGAADTVRVLIIPEPTIALSLGVIGALCFRPRPSRR